MKNPIIYIISLLALAGCSGGDAPLYKDPAQPAEKRAEAARAVQAKLEPLGGIGGEFTKRLDAARAEAQQKLRALCDRQDFFERRLLRAFPSLRSVSHADALKKLKENLHTRRK